jgi:hypothetical protein
LVLKKKSVITCEAVMADEQHTPESLDKQLNQLLSSKHPDESGDPLIDTAVRLANAPHPQLSPRSVARIQAQVLDAHRRQTRPAQPRPPRWTWLLAMSAAAILIVVTASLVARVRNLQGSGVPLIPSSLTPISSATQINPTAMPSVSTAASNTTGTSTAPIISPTAAITLEGSVQTIDANLITISGIAIQLDPNDPLLTVLQVGDDLHVEGTPQQGANGLVIIASSARLVNSDVFNNGDGQVWRDNGNCNNPPPAWAPAYGWHRRCDGRSGNANGGNPGNGNGGNGN